MPNFTTDKTEYEAGETISFKNTSQNGSSYLWTFPSGQSKDENPTYQISPLRPEGEIIVNLQVTSKNGKKSSQSERTIKITPLANLTFWNCTSCYGALPIHITINGVTKDITGKYAGEPGDCGALNCASFALPAGVYIFSAIDNNGVSLGSGTISVSKGQCILIRS